MKIRVDQKSKVEKKIWGYHQSIDCQGLKVSKRLDRASKLRCYNYIRLHRWFVVCRKIPTASRPRPSAINSATYQEQVIQNVSLRVELVRCFVVGLKLRNNLDIVQGNT